MTKVFGILLVAVLATACAVRDGLKGDKGDRGSDGHSIVSTVSAVGFPLCATSGVQYDMYLDKDDDLSVSASDTFTNSSVLCNGANGLNGVDGTNGIDGINGLDGAPGLAGPPGLDGTNGTDGTNGVDGLPGPTGPVGPSGPQGIAGAPGTSVTITPYTSSSCVLIAGTTLYVKNTGVSTAKIYALATCTGTVTATLNVNGSIWLTSTVLAVNAVGTGIKVIKFN